MERCDLRAALAALQPDDMRHSSNGSRSDLGKNFMKGDVC
jgi:hypothetical protein